MLGSVGQRRTKQKTGQPGNANHGFLSRRRAIATQYRAKLTNGFVPVPRPASDDVYLYASFLGVAAYLALVGLQRDLFGVRPIDVVRYAAAITLMWASVEKWAYPQWTFPLLVERPGMTLGYDPEFFMRAAGVIEFTLAFALLCTPLVRRCASVLLAAMFISAIFEFGKLDAIGHALIIVVLLALMADDAPATNKVRYAALAPIGYGIALAVFLGVYYFAHTLLFGTPPVA